MKQDYWLIRSEKYNQLNWVTKQSNLDTLIEFCNLKTTDNVLEVGCGTGVVSKALVEQCNQVVASDFSKDMLFQLESNDNIITMCCDLEKMKCFDNCFDKIVGRMVFHHIENLSVGFKNCYNMLKKGGELIIQEGVPPRYDKETVKWFSDTFALKEKRHTFTFDSLYDLFCEANFDNIQTKVIIDEKFSIKNWLINSNQNQEIQDIIYKRHLDAPEEIKKVYNMRITNEDILIDSKILIIKGVK